ncbi:HAD family hydrolase [Staphylococcus sp. 17KM0847]|uniref:HAD family hydrolase n=1 Tax=Staphylococcus sp. 17KM0847 TaxID=2583989 RepID=UPI00215583E9|nr:HAD family hydrolase [Staphylococcus sp. 17KM0847]
MVRWILFDKDGTLIEFDQSWVKIGIQLVDDVCKHFNIEQYEMLCEEIGIDGDTFKPGSIMASGSLEDMVSIFNRYTQEDTSSWAATRSQQLIDTREPESILYEGVSEVLYTLKERGYHLAIVTGDNASGMHHFLTTTGFETVFDCVISTDSHHYEKPDARLLQPLWEKGIKGEEMVMVGDTDLDMQMGYNAGCLRTVGVRTGLGTQATFDKADIVLDDVTRLLAYLDTISLK